MLPQLKLITYSVSLLSTPPTSPAACAKKFLILSKRSFTVPVITSKTNLSLAPLPPAIRDTLEEKLSAASDWIYADGHDAAEDVLSTRLKELKDLVNPVLNRKDEASKRPSAITELKEQIEGLKSVIPMVQEQISSAAAASSSRAAEEASKSAPPSASPSSADALDDLEEEDMLKSASSSEAPAPTEIPSIYDEADLKFLEETIEKSTKWLEEKEAAQRKLKETDDPAVTIKELQNHTQKVRDAVMDMMTKKMRVNYQKPKSKKPKKPKTKKVKTSKSASSDATTASATPSSEPGNGPTEEELREALEKAGIKGDGIKLKNFGHKAEMKDKDGNPLTKLDIGEDATEEDILAAIDRVTQQAREKKEKDEL